MSFPPFHPEGGWATTDIRTDIPIGWNAACPLKARTITTSPDTPTARSTVHVTDVYGVPLFELQYRAHRPFYTLAPNLANGIVIVSQTFHYVTAPGLSS